jgi:hypothetical protein
LPAQFDQAKSQQVRLLLLMLDASTAPQQARPRHQLNSRSKCAGPMATAFKYVSVAAAFASPSASLLLLPLRLLMLPLLLCALSLQACPPAEKQPARLLIMFWCRYVLRGRQWVLYAALPQAAGLILHCLSRLLLPLLLVCLCMCLGIAPLSQAADSCCLAVLLPAMLLLP